jgi:molecular chaperone HtpG
MIEKKKEEATTVIDDITTIQTENANIKERYFKVTLINVSNELLLNQNNIIDYLSMVAPVPYKKGFIFQKLIYDKANDFNFSIDEYPVYVNNNQIFKSYTTSIYEGEKNNKKKIDEIHQLEFFDFKNKKNDLIYWGWFSISNFTKQIPKINFARGIRLRKGNIQIGMDNCFVKLFKESRGSYYFFGEIFAVSPKLIPNSRRDYFLENKTLVYFEKELNIVFTNLHKLYHFSSTIRNTKKKVDKLIEFQNEFEKKIEKGFTNNEEREKYEEKLEAIQDEAIKAEDKLERTATKLKKSEFSAEKKVFEKVVGNRRPNISEIINNNHSDTKTKYITDELAKLNRKDRKLISRIFAVIDNVLPKEIASILKEKIKEELQ